MLGIRVTSVVRREADDMGRLTHIFFIFDPNDSGPVECHHGTELVPRAPPRSRFLGATGDDMLYCHSCSARTREDVSLTAWVGF
eukprot:4816844-Prymnesium_polylepis.1